MWNEVVGLLDIGFRTDEDYQHHVANLRDLNDWLRREYPSTTVEEVRLAYNKAVKHELSRLGTLIPVLAPKYVGDVLSAYTAQMQDDLEVNRVFATQMLVEPAPQPTPEQIDELMRQALKGAIKTVKSGGRYTDTGSAMYKWLYQLGQIAPTDEEWIDYLEAAQVVVRETLVSQKAALPSLNPTPGQQAQRKAIERKLGDLMNGYFSPDYKGRVRAQAMQQCLHDYIVRLAGEITPKPAPSDSKPPINAEPFSHETFMRELIEQLPAMDDETVSDLQRRAKERNVLDIYLVATQEWERRSLKTVAA